jgi:F0F1-type ATP synthase membrane subunit c/vacuolar-type H+-ATPase subunit K
MRIAQNSAGTILLLAGIAMAGGQATHSAASGPLTQNSMPTAGRPPEIPRGDFVREIDDPNTGDRWLLTRDSRHPGGPGLLILVSFVGGPSRQANSEIPPPIIHAGDRVIVEERTAVMEARLEAIALGPAIAGSSLNLRLILGSKVVRAVARGPSNAVYQGEVQR